MNTFATVVLLTKGIFTKCIMPKYQLLFFFCCKALQVVSKPLSLQQKCF